MQKSYECEVATHSQSERQLSDWYAYGKDAIATRAHAIAGPDVADAALVAPGSGESSQSNAPWSLCVLWRCREYSGIDRHTVKQLLKSVVRQIRTLRSVGAGGGRLPPATRWPRAIALPTPTLLVAGGKRHTERAKPDSSASFCSSSCLASQRTQNDQTIRRPHWQPARRVSADHWE